jgi:hypothetical protein
MGGRKEGRKMGGGHKRMLKGTERKFFGLCQRRKRKIKGGIREVGGVSGHCFPSWNNCYRPRHTA